MHLEYPPSINTSPIIPFSFIVSHFSTEMHKQLAFVNGKATTVVQTILLGPLPKLLPDSVSLFHNKFTDT